MKRIYKFLYLLFLIILFMSPKIAFAETSCSEIFNYYQDYVDYQSELNSLSCDSENLSESDVGKCNEISLNQSYLLSKLFKANEDNSDCFNTQMQQLMEEKQNECSPVITTELKNIAKKILALFYIAGPILLIVFGSLDFTKAVVASDEKVMKKAQSKFFQRLVATLLLFLSPVIVNILLNLIDFSDNYGGIGYSCNYTYRQYQVQYDVQSNGLSSSNVIRVIRRNGEIVSSGSTTGDWEDWRQADPRWGSINIITGSMGATGCTTTAIAIQVARSGAATTNIDPGVVANAFLNHNVYVSAGITWTKQNEAFQDIAPTFKYENVVTTDGNNNADWLAQKINEGYYPVMEIKKNSCGQHWVAVISVEGDTVNIVDPARTNVTSLPDATYSCYSNYNSRRVALYKVEN